MNNSLKVYNVELELKYAYSSTVISDTIEGKDERDAYANAAKEWPEAVRISIGDEYN